MSNTIGAPPSNPFASDKRALLWQEIIKAGPQKVDKEAILKEISDRKKSKLQ